MKFIIVQFETFDLKTFNPFNCAKKYVTNYFQIAPPLNYGPETPQCVIKLKVYYGFQNLV